MTPQVAVDSFTDFAASAEPRLRIALGASFGFDLGQEATAEALAYAWEHWESVRVKVNPIGFLFAVGRNTIRYRLRARVVSLPPVRATELPWIEPGLPAALSQLSERQRQVVMLLHCFEWTLSEVAETLALSKGAVQVHDRRGLTRLRHTLGVR